MIALPDTLKVFLTFIVTQGVKSLANLCNRDIKGWGSVATVVVVGSVIFFVEGMLAIVPPESQKLIGGIVAFLAVLVSSFGVHRTIKTIGTG